MKKMKNNIYLDYAANTPVDENVLKVFNDATLKYFANPNSTHPLGVEVNEKIKESTQNILKMLEEKANLDQNSEIIYTSGSSESNNLAIKGIASTYKENGRHIITTFIEHSSVSSPLTYLKEQGYEIDVVNIKEDGTVDLEHLKNLLRDDTILVTICYVDSEVGTVQPIQEISKILKEYPNCAFHVDATQAVGKVNIDFKNIDLISFAPHKFYGLNGFGVLIKKKNIVLEPLINGGASTTIYRSGTPVVGQILALEKALRICLDEYDNRYEYVKSLNKKIREEISKLDNVYINTIADENVYILNISVKDVKAVEFKRKLEEYGICVSIKSACTVTITPSRIVMAMTHDRKRALSSFRISLSHLVTQEEINKFLEIFKICYEELTNGR
jgi:cysteine desulfurase